MKCLVVYSSRTGNTKKVAEAIFAVMPEGTDIFPVEKNPELNKYDFVALGFWVDRETADKKAQEYMSKISGKKLALFATLGAYPDSDYARKSMINAKELVKDNKIVGEFMCQGKIDPKMTERLEKLPPGHPHGMTPERRARHEEASKHPNGEDFQQAQIVFKEILTRIAI